ncbi:MAG: DUF2007 domain-containing protein [Actinomycetota bacterium]
MKASVLDPAPPRTGGGDGGGGGWAWLVTAQDIFEAHIIRGLLEAEGILPVFLDTRDPSPGAWMFLSGNINALVRIFVPRSLLDSARLVMLEAGVKSDIAVKPNEQVVAARRSWLWLAIVIAIALALFIASIHRPVM